MVKLLDYIKYIKENTYFDPDDFLPIGIIHRTCLIVKDYDGSIVYEDNCDDDEEKCWNLYQSLKRGLKNGGLTKDTIIKAAKKLSSRLNG